ncbi:efflux RND transporter permease subunit [Photobacterium angustum]|uniref:efflux RND transporter permease subunit n=1 Tax=Photobacterium angustum TaxID=661 RepID=UPI0005E1BE89|nr:efflux RND transporter permease subunit [Photobacterium angustum]KJG01051.1 acriflavin resistance protein [Photobacterium angustum]KJG16606.1 acriflavin resistance protein [Photobacterium angustum]KJG22749.1 acriflavin resistance protein [Photobacterium angustum]KJG29716.1 acriflavin resistance protein [Photobacterium angustum]PSV69435.1 AcrB/AcrD/AcrF family protein [Photobacterium angustum]
MKAKGLIAWFTHNHVAANLLMLLVILGGLFSISLINKEIFPAFAMNRIMITASYPGASPEDIEQSINIKIEQSLDNVKNIKRIESVASQGLASLTLELETGADLEKVLDDVKQQIDAITTFPVNMETPLIKRAEFTSNVMFISLYGNLNERQLKEYAKQVRDDILLETSASDVVVSGVKDYEIAIDVSENALRKYGLTFEQVANAVQQRSIDLPGGIIKAKDGDLLVRTNGQLYSGDAFSSIVLRTRSDGSRLLLSDVATVSDGFVENRVLNRFNRKRAAVIQVRNLTDEDATKISHQVSEYIAKKQAQLPSDVYLDTWGDMSHYLEGRLNMMLSNMLYGGVLVFVILALFLDIRVAFWVILGIPFCFLGTLLFMPTPFIAVSINLISLFGFILVLGIVVDDAIVVGESVYTEVKDKGQRIENVIKGVQNVAIPATFGVLTTMAAFIPMLISDAPRTEFFKAIAWIVLLCLSFSLIESKLILPAHLARMRLTPPSKKPHLLSRLKLRFNSAVDRFINHNYRRFITVCTRHRYSVLATFSGILMLAIALVVSGQLRWVFFPNLPSDYIQVNVDMDVSSSDENNARVAAQIEDALYQADAKIYQELGVNVVKHTFMNMANRQDLFILAELHKTETLPISSFEILKQWKAQMPPLVGVKNITYDASIDRKQSDLQFSLKGENLTELAAASKAMQQLLSEYDGTLNIKDDLSSPIPEVKLQLTAAGEALGLSLSALANQVRHAFFGYEAQRVLRNNEEVKVMVRYPQQERSTIGYLENMKVRLPNGKFVPFTEVATANIESSYTNINRVDRKRSVIVSANVDKAQTAPSDIYNDILTNKLDKLQQQYPDIKIALDGRAKDEKNTKGSLIRDSLLALLTIFALMAIPLRSYSQPLIIMSVIPFGIIGAIAGHYLAGLTLNLLSVFGILALAGVVVNDSLVLVTFINRALKQGVDLQQAVIDAGCARFRAIVLTSLTTFFGLAPILLEDSLQAQIVIPMATSLAFGILFATVVTLLLVPSLYLILQDVQSVIRRFYHWWWQPRTSE